MNQPESVHELQTHQALTGYLLQAGQGEIILCAALAVKLAELVKVVSQQLSHDEEVLLEVEIVVELYIYIYI